MKLKRFITILICCCLLQRPCLAQLNAAETTIIDYFSSQLETDLAQDQLHAGISAAVVCNGKLIWASALGYANSTTTTPADTTTVYRIGSITKTFTAALLLLLTEEGKVNPDDPLEKYVPEARQLKGYSSETLITLRQLASHTSGLQREPAKRNHSTGNLAQWQNKVLECIPYTSFQTPPATAWLYSNIGYALLGLALERAAGIPYLQMVQDKIITPLGMTQTCFELPAGQRVHLAHGINNSNNQTDTLTPVQELEGRGYRVPNGGLFSTPADLAKFVTALTAKKQLLSAGSLREMQTVPKGGKNYGLGLVTVNSQTLSILEHSGSVAGYTAEFMTDKNSGYAVILMRNYNKGKTDLSVAARNLLIRLARAAEAAHATTP